MSLGGLGGFYRGKTVLVTGHTGFKGSWMCKVLAMLGADVVGYALDPPTAPSLFALSGVGVEIKSIKGDIRDLKSLSACMEGADIAIHMAAQPIVRVSYEDPVGTFDVNVMGTVNFMEAVRLNPSVMSVVNITTDKVYQNSGRDWGYRESDALNGHDPYSNSKSCSELVTACYKSSFFGSRDIAVSTCRAGNVIGGGDFAQDRIIPDCVRAVGSGKPVAVRNPHSTRPYQHALEPVCAYLMVAARQYCDRSLQGCYNIGPDDRDCVATGDLASLFCAAWGSGSSWEDASEQNAPHEAKFLKLDCSLAKEAFGWKPRWRIQTAIEKVVEWSRAYYGGGDVSKVMQSQIEEYLQWGQR